MSNPYNAENPYGQQPQQQPADFNPNAAYGYQAPQAPVLAHWGLRVGSGLIDGLIVAVPYLVLMQVSFALGLIVLLALAVGLAYREGTTGQTPGKQVLGTRTVKEADGQVLGFGLALGRRLLHIVDGIPCYLGYLWPIWDEKKQTFADKIVSSVVIVSK